MNRREVLWLAMGLPFLPAVIAKASVEPSYNWIRYQFSRRNPAIVLADYMTEAGLSVDWPAVQVNARMCEEPVEYVMRIWDSEGNKTETSVFVSATQMADEP